MTQILQRAQTTAERVRDMAVSQIAAEIDALTAQRDEAQRIIGVYNTSRDEVIAQLCETNDALRAERDEALAEVVKWRKELTLCNQERFDAQTQLAESRAEVESLRVVNRQVRADYASQIGPLKAEVERLRPAAEAWEAYEDYQSTTSQSNMIRTITEKWPSMADVAQKARAFMVAAARARAAKGAQP